MEINPAVEKNEEFWKTWLGDKSVDMKIENIKNIKVRKLLCSENDLYNTTCNSPPPSVFD